MHTVYTAVIMAERKREREKERERHDCQIDRDKRDKKNASGNVRLHSVSFLHLYLCVFSEEITLCVCVMYGGECRSSEGTL